MENTLEDPGLASSSSSTSNWDPFSSQEVQTSSSTSDWANFQTASSSSNQGADQIVTTEEWADFVETPKLVQKSPLLTLLENLILTQNTNPITFCENIPENELNLASNPTWNELKRYTSINDESLSLKYKWSLSNLEDEYLKSLELQRQLPVQTKKPNFFFSTELQPVKIEINNENRQNVENSETLTEFEQITNQISPIQTEPVTVLSNTALNIDLSYFESRIESEKEQDVKSKNYLNKLLTEIYATTTATTTTSNANNKDDDFDKKSNTSDSSNNSMHSQQSTTYRVNPSSIKLEPSNLEKQFKFINLYDLNQNKYP